MERTKERNIEAYTTFVLDIDGVFGNKMTVIVLVQLNNFYSLCHTAGAFLYFPYEKLSKLSL